MYFKRIILIYILIPLFLVVMVSCDRKPDEQPSATVVKQEVVTMKITPINKSGADKQSPEGTPHIDKQVDKQEAIGKKDIVYPVAKSDRNSNPTAETEAPTTPETGKVAAQGTDVSTKSASEQKSKDVGIVSDSTAPAVNTDKNSGDIASVSRNELPSPATDQNSQSEKSDGDIKGVDNNALLPLVNEENLFYNAKGKIDPFDPLIKEKTPVAETETKQEENIPERILTPLEKLDFSQMKLVAILNRDSGSVAMVQESTGKGYIVGIGTYIGRNSGQVVSIEKDKLVIQEKVKDYKGNVVDRFQELKLNKLDDKG